MYSPSGISGSQFLDILCLWPAPGLGEQEEVRTRITIGLRKASRAPVSSQGGEGKSGAGSEASRCSSEKRPAAPESPWLMRANSRPPFTEATAMVGVEDL